MSSPTPPLVFPVCNSKCKGNGTQRGEHSAISPMTPCSSSETRVTLKKAIFYFENIIIIIIPSTLDNIVVFNTFLNMIVFTDPE